MKKMKEKHEQERAFNKFLKDKKRMENFDKKRSTRQGWSTVPGESWVCKAGGSEKRGLTKTLSAEHRALSSWHACFFASLLCVP